MAAESIRQFDARLSYRVIVTPLCCISVSQPPVHERAMDI